MDQSYGLSISCKMLPGGKYMQAGAQPQGEPGALHLESDRCDLNLSPGGQYLS